MHSGQKPNSENNTRGWICAVLFWTVYRCIVCSRQLAVCQPHMDFYKALFPLLEIRSRPRIFEEHHFSLHHLFDPIPFWKPIIIQANMTTFTPNPNFDKENSNPKDWAYHLGKCAICALGSAEQPP